MSGIRAAFLQPVNAVNAVNAIHIFIIIIIIHYYYVMQNFNSAD